MHHLSRAARDLPRDVVYVQGAALVFPPLADKGRVETAQRLPTAFYRAPLHDGLVEEAMVREKLRRLPREGDGAVHPTRVSNDVKSSAR